MTLLVVVAVAAWASKPWPWGLQVVQPDGSLLTVYLRGDADQHWLSTADGVLLMEQGGAYYVATVSASGELSASSQLAHEPLQRTPAEAQLAASQNLKAHATMVRARRTPIGTVYRYMPHQGEVHVPVLLVQFQDVKFQLADPVAQISQQLDTLGRLKEMGNADSLNVGSVRQYYRSCSHGKFDPRFDVYGVYTLPDSIKSYIPSSKRDSMFAAALRLADADVDFSKYDSNDDGYVDGLYIVFAGFSGAVTGNQNSYIWPYAKFGNLGTFDGKVVSAHCASAELNGLPTSYQSTKIKRRITGIGTFCHEFGHTLGLPDLYPSTSSSGDGLDNQGLEYWSLMDGGEYLSSGHAPTALNAWEREVLGYETADTLTEARQVELLSYEKGGRGVKILNPADPDGKEYLLLENIQRRGANVAAKGHGLIVYHVDYAANSVNTMDFPNNTAGHPQITVLAADGRLMSQTSAINEGGSKASSLYYQQLAGDTYPGTTGIDSIDSFTVYNASPLVRPILNITETADGRITFDYLEAVPTSVNGIIANRNADSRVYSLSGQLMGTSLEGLAPGVYIQNNKKIIITKNKRL